MSWRPLQIGWQRLTVLAILLVASTYGASRLWRDTSPASAPLSRNEPTYRSRPRQVTPTRRFQDSVDRLLLLNVLDKLRPLSPKNKLSVTMATHALRLWGTEADLPDRATTSPALAGGAWQFSPSTMLSVLLDGNEFQKMYPNGPPLLTWHRSGVFVRAFGGRFGERPVNVWPDCEYHCDKIISVLAEIGVPADREVRAEGMVGTVKDLLRGATSRFSRNQELEFSAKAFLLYLQLPATWTNRLGEEVSVNRIIQKIGQSGLGSGACLGTHRCQAMALALRIDESERFLGEADRRDLERHLHLVSQSLTDRQNDDGSWPPNWHPGVKSSADLAADGELATRIRVAGHHLEWIAIAPARFTPPDHVVRKAIHYLQRTMSGLSPRFQFEHFPLLTHAARALVLLAGCENSAVLSETTEDRR